MALSQFPRSQVAERMVAHKADLLALDQQTLIDMGRQWLRVEEALEGQISALAMEAAEAKASGQAITVTNMFKRERYQRLLDQVRQQIDQYNDYVDDLVTGNRRKLAKMGSDQAAELIQMSLLEGGETAVAASFDRLPVTAIENIVATAGPGGPVHTLLADAYPMAVDHMTDTLIQNTVMGINPRQTASDMLDGAAEGLNHALTVARTEQIRAYREATRQQYEISGIVQQYKRLAAKNSRTCPLCLALDGEVYPTEDLMNVHPNDRCTMVPVVDGMPEVTWETGSEWFAKQDPDVQKEILGPKAYDLYDEGRIELRDLVQKTTHETWGPSLKRRPLSDLRGGEYQK